MSKTHRAKTPTSLASNITITYLIAFAVVLFAFGIFVLISFRMFFLRTAEEDIKCAFENVSQDFANIEEKAEKAAHEMPVIITLFDNEKNEIFTAKANENLFVTPFIDKVDKYTDYYKINLHYAVLNQKIYIHNQPHYLQISRNLQTENISFSILSNVLILGVILSLIVNSIIGYNVAHFLLRPISQMTATIKEISVNNLDRRLNTSNARSELKELAVSFNEMFDRIELSYQNQKRFVSDASHELRTPLAVIQGYSDMLSRWGKEDPAVINEAVEAIKTQTTAMTRLVDRLLFLTRAENNNLNVVKKHFILNELYEEIINDMRILHTQHKFIVDIPESFEIYADFDLVRQLLLILLDNAVKYTPSQGEITLSAKKEDKKVIISVSDTGIGIPKEHIDKIFDRFYRIDPSRTKGMGGFGLGLSIAKQIVLAHGGDISAKSEEQKGTTINVIIPN